MGDDEIQSGDLHRLFADSAGTRKYSQNESQQPLRLKTLPSSPLLEMNPFEYDALTSLCILSDLLSNFFVNGETIINIRFQLKIIL